MIASGFETRTVPASQTLEVLGQQLLRYPHTRRVSNDRERDQKGHRQSTEYTDSSGELVDLNDMLANTFSIGREPIKSAVRIKAASPASEEKTDRKLMPKLSTLKRRRRSVALHLLADIEAKNEAAS